MPYDPFQTQPQDTWNQFAANDYLRRQRALAGLDTPQLASPPPGMDTSYHNGPDFQDSWNHIAAAQNGTMRESDAAQPQADPRQMAAQMLYRKYAPHEPRYANYGGSATIDDKPINDLMNSSAMQVPMSGPGGYLASAALGAVHGGDATFQQKLGDARMRNSSDFMNRMTGNQVATTQDRGLLNDPQYQRLNDPQRVQLYGEVYGHPLSEDIQGDNMRTLDPSHLAQTAAQVRFRNTMPARQKDDQGWLASQEANFGGNPYELISPLRRDDKGQPMSGYDDTTQTAYIPGQTVMEPDPKNPFAQIPVTKPARAVRMERWMKNEIELRKARSAGMERYPTDPQMQPPNVPGMARNLFNSFAGADRPQMQQRPQGPQVVQEPPAPADPVREQRIAQARQVSTQTLSRYGIQIPPQQIDAVMRRAVELSGGKQFDEGTLIQAAREGISGAAALGNFKQNQAWNQVGQNEQERVARDAYNQRMAPRPMVGSPIYPYTGGSGF